MSFVYTTISEPLGASQTERRALHHDLPSRHTYARLPGVDDRDYRIVWRVLGEGLVLTRSGWFKSCLGYGYTSHFSYFHDSVNPNYLGSDEAALAWLMEEECAK